MNAVYALAFLACPVGMGLMMWFMSKGMMGGKKEKPQRGEGNSLPDLKAEQARLAAKIDALDRERPTVEPSASEEPERVRAS